MEKQNATLSKGSLNTLSNNKRKRDMSLYSKIILGLVLILIFPIIYKITTEPVKDKRELYLMYLLLALVILVSPKLIKMIININHTNQREKKITGIILILSITISMVSIIYMITAKKNNKEEDKN